MKIGINKLRSKFEELFGIDLRSLAFFRIGIALVVLFDLAVRSTDLTAFYTDSGVLPRLSLLNHNPNPWVLSIHFMSGTVLGQTILFVIQGICAIGLLLGFKTRWMAFLSWFLMASLQRRNPLILGGADNYLRMMLFWGMFVPLGARYSLDNILNPDRHQYPKSVLNWATAAILLQTAFVYEFTALHKWQGELWKEGSALYYTLNLDMYAQWPAESLLQFPLLLQWMTSAILWFESIGPFLLFFPFLTVPIRSCTIGCFLLMQLGFYSLMYLKLFPAISVVALILFLPSWFWERWAYPLRDVMLSRFKFMERIARQCFDYVRLMRPLRPDTTIPYNHSPDKIPANKTPLGTSAAVAFFLIFVFFWTLGELIPSKLKMPKPLHNFGTFIYVDQAWKMFAPNPARLSGWLVVPGVLADGTQLDISRNGAPVSWTKPPQRSMFKNERWRKYFVHFSLRKDKRVWNDYARYLCRSWNARHTDEKKLVSLEIVLMARQTPPECEKIGEYGKKSLLNYACRDKSKK